MVVLQAVKFTFPLLSINQKIFKYIRIECVRGAAQLAGYLEMQGILLVVPDTPPPIVGIANATSIMY